MYLYPLKLTLFILILPFITFGCSPSSSDVENPFCPPESISENCTFDVGITQLSLHSTHPDMPEEQEITLLIKSDDMFDIQNATLSGVNMYMGTIPVRFERVEDNRWEAFIRLGVCASPQMIWRLNILFSHPHEEQLEVEFSAKGR